MGLVRVDGDGVGSGVVGHAEPQRLPDVPELDVVVTVNDVGFQGDALTVQVESLGAGLDGEGCESCPSTKYSRSGDDACRQQGHFFSSAHDLFLLQLFCFGKQHNTEEGFTSPAELSQTYGEEKR